MPRVDTGTFVPDSTGSKMIVGNRYEMYAPVAKAAVSGLGVVWKDAEGYSFEYRGTLSMCGRVLIVTPDITYDGTKMSVAEYEGGVDLRLVLGGVSALCPIEHAKQFIRPVTDG